MSGLPEEMNLIQIGDPMALKLFVRSSSVFFLHLCSPPSAPPLFLRRFTPASKLLEIPTHAPIPYLPSQQGCLCTNTYLYTDIPNCIGCGSDAECCCFQQSFCFSLGRTKTPYGKGGYLLPAPPFSPPFLPLSVPLTFPPSVYLGANHLSPHHTLSHSCAITLTVTLTVVFPPIIESM